MVKFVLWVMQKKYVLLFLPSKKIIFYFFLIVVLSRHKPLILQENFSNLFPKYTKTTNIVSKKKAICEDLLT